MKKTITLLIFMVFSSISAQTLLQESFDTSLNWTVARTSGTSTNAGWISAASGRFSGSGSSPYSGAKMAVFNSYDISSGSSFSLTSPVVAFAGASYQVKFRVYQNGTSSSTDQISVFYNTNASLTGATVLGSVRRVLNDVDQANGWYTYVYDIPGTPTGNGHIILLGGSNNGFDIAVDDISVQVKNTCAFPLTDGVSNLTARGALVSFQNVGTSYDYVLNTTYTDPVAGAVVSNTPDFYVNLTNLTPSTTYYFHVRNSCGTAEKSDWKTIVFRTATPPSNDTCAGAITLAPSSRFDADFTTGTTINSNRTAVLPSSVCASNYDDVWYKAVIPASGSLTFETKPVAESLLTDTSLIVYSGTCSSLSTISCNMDFSADKFSKVTISGRTPGETVYVAVFAVTGSGEFKIEAYDASLVPSNNNCSTPQAVVCGTSFTSNQITANLRGANVSTPNSAFPACKTTNTTHNLWYTVVVPASGNLTIAKVAVSSFANAILSAYAGNGCTNLTEIGCTNGDLLKLTGRTPGETITFSLWNNSSDGTSGIFNVSAYVTPVVPANDLCTGAIALNVGTSFAANAITGTNAGAITNPTTSTCATSGNSDVWYTAVVPASGKLTIETDAASSSLFTDSLLQVFSGTCGNLTSITCNDDGGNGSFSKIVLTGRTPGETIYIGVYNYVNREVLNGSFKISAYDLPPISNDNCSGALALTVGNSIASNQIVATNEGATTSSQTATCGNSNFDVWFKAVVPASGRLTIETDFQTGSVFDDSIINVFSGSCGALTSLACNDDDVNDNFSKISLTGRTPGETVYIAVYNFSSNDSFNGPFKISAYETLVPPVNDDCSGAISLTVGNSFASNQIIATNVGATTSSQTTTCGNSNFDVWFKAVIPASGKLTIETDLQAGSSFSDSVISVFSGTCGTLSNLACNDDEGNGNFSKINLIGRTPGETVYIAVYNFSSSNLLNGPFKISAYDTTTLSTDGFDKETFSYYPNPIQNILNLNYSETISTIEVFNILGQRVLVKKNDASSAQVDMASLAQGQYIVKLTSGDVTQTIKVIKE
ncbi:MAG: T9SS type A sorting domain-containing protein [Flavobacterium sp.]